MITIPSVKPVAIRSPMAEYVQFGTTKSIGTWGGASTAYFAWKGASRLTVEWGGTGWSGGAATQTYTGTALEDFYYAYISRGCSGAGAKTVKAYPTDSSGRRIGKIINIQLDFFSGTNNTSGITSIDVKNARELEKLTVDLLGGSVTSLDVSGMKRLTALSTGVSASTLVSVNVAGCTSLETLRLVNTSITSLDVSNLTALQSLNLESCGITSLDVSNLTALWNLNLLNCSSLTSLRAQNVMLYTESSTVSYSYAANLNGGANLQNTSGMSTAAMEQFYTDLATNTTGFGSIIAVLGSGGSDANASIATAKGYTVIGIMPP